MEHRGTVSLLMLSIYGLLCLLLFLTSCTSGEVITAADEAAPECVVNTLQDPLRGRSDLSTYAGRGFLADGNHLGWDIALAEGRAVYPIGCGTVRLARAARGYGTLVVVVEHRLASGVTIRNGAGQRVFVDRFLSIYGHMRHTSERDGRGTKRTLRPGDLVTPTTVLGYIENGALNGDGAEHLHLGIRLQTAEEAAQTDPTAWFRGYDTMPSLARWFADPELLLQQLSADRMSATMTDAGSERMDTAVNHPLPADTIDAGEDRLLGWEREPTTDVTVADVSRFDAGTTMVPDAPYLAQDATIATFRDVGEDRMVALDIPPITPDVPPSPSRIRYEFRIRSTLRVTAPYRLHDQWWRAISCLNTGSLDPSLTTDGYARCEAERIDVFDGSVFLPDHSDWGDRGQIGTVANVPERCTPVQGAEWRITDLGTNRLLYAGPVSGLQCMSVGSQDRLRLPE